ncbi:MAG: alpha/beta hydrolase [bacterium]|nr:alpha/beta hydrolase [bacterium]
MKTTAWLFLTILTVLSTNSIVSAEPVNKSEKITIGVRHTLQSTRLGEERAFHVYLPNEYSNSDQTYPVLYLLDGDKELFLSSAMTTWALARMAPNLPGSSQLAPDMIVVGIPSPDRGRDYWPVDPDGKKAAPGASKFLEFLAEELVPFIDTNYRTSPPRIVFGQSLGSLFARFAFFSKPSIFQACIASSAGFPNCKEFLFSLTSQSLKSQSFDRHRMYLTSGGLDPFHEQFEKQQIPEFLRLLEKKGPPGMKWKYRIYPDEGHVPFHSLRHGLIWIFSSWGNA